MNNDELLKKVYNELYEYEKKMIEVKELKSKVDQDYLVIKERLDAIRRMIFDIEQLQLFIN